MSAANQAHWIHALLLSAGLLCAGSLSAATFIVNGKDDTAGSTCGAVCTMRQAISAANATSAADTINLDIDTIPPRGDIVIQPLNNLPPHHPAADGGWERFRFSSSTHHARKLPLHAHALEPGLTDGTGLDDQGLRRSDRAPITILGAMHAGLPLA